MGNRDILKNIKKYKFNSVFLRILITILVITTIPFGLISLMVYKNSDAAMSQETLNMTKEKTEKIVAASDNFIKSMDRLSSTILQLDEVQKLFVTEGSRVNLSEDYLGLMEKLSMFTLSYGYIQSIEVYSELNDCITTENKSVAFENSEPELMLWYCGDFINDFGIFTYENAEPKNETIVFMRRKMLGGERLGFVAIKVHVDKLIQTVGMNVDDENDVIMLVDENDRIILSSQRSCIGKPISEVVETKGDAAYMDERAYVVSYADAAKNNLRYIYMYNPAYYRLASESMVRLSLILIVCVILISIFIALYVSAQAFRPLAEIIEQFDNEGEMEQDMNEVGYITRNILNVSNENTYLSEEMQKKMVLMNKAQISALQNQINPHFIHNTLETIKWLVTDLEEEDTSASFMIEMLSKVLKYSLDMSNYLVDLESEIENTKSYISILQIRYADKFDVVWDVDEAAMNSKIIKLSLQPIIENAVLHGVNQTRRKGNIRIKIDTVNEKLRVVVADNGIGIKPQVLEKLQKSLEGEEIVTKKGIGLTNVNFRIKLVFGDEYGLKITSEEGIGTTVTMLMKRQ